ncbi:MAG: hypothetical protein JXQ75_20855 [Phycisphaerae bacterium]|nr:hypothetical protein [Phycisphaerae bacterium]
MPTLFARRYMRQPEAVGTTEKVLGIVLLLLLVGIVAAYVWQSMTNEEYLFSIGEAVEQGQEESRDAPIRMSDDDTAAPLSTSVGEETARAPATTSEVGVEGPFPESAAPGWRAPVQVSRFTPDNLYQKIDGRADLYLQFHVVGLTFGAYCHETDRQRMIDVYWYDMGTPENALGAYRSEAPEGATPVSIGRDGYEVDGAVFFIKGSQYVQILPGTPDESDGAAARQIATRIGEAIEAGSQDPWATDALPRKGRVSDSLEYMAEDVFGLDFLKDVFTAEYDLEGERMTLFIHRAGDGAAARQVLDQYVGYFEEYGNVVWKDADDSRRIVAGEATGVIDVVFAKGRYVGGVAGAENLEAAKRAATAFYDGLAVP